MQFKILLASATVAAMAAAAPAAASASTFGLIAIKSGSSIQNAALTAYNNALWIGQPQNTTCDSESSSTAFELSGEKLFLYGQSGALKQQFQTVRSGMGQGVLVYLDTNETGGNGVETSGFEITDSHLTFNGSSFIACPYDESSYTVWVDVGIENPAGESNCTAFAAHAVETSSPVGCYYY